MPQTQIAMGRAFTYLDNLGRIGTSSTTLWHPVGLGRGADDVMYVANWGHEFGAGTRITKCTITTQEFLLDIGSPGSGDSQFLWPGGLAVDDQENLYVTDQAISKVVIFTKDGEFVGKWGNLGSGDGQFDKPPASPSTPTETSSSSTAASTESSATPEMVSSSANSAKAAAAMGSWPVPGVPTLTPTATSTWPTGATTGCRSSPPTATTWPPSAVLTTKSPTSADPAPCLLTETGISTWQIGATSG